MKNERIIKEKERNGAEYLRDLIQWLNARPEERNENKSHLTLIGEFNQYEKAKKMYLSGKILS